MQELYKSGRYFYALAIIAFGMIQFVTGNFMSAFLPIFDGLPGRSFFLYFISTLFVAGGLLMFRARSSRRMALLLGFLFSLFFFYPHLVRLFSDLHNGGNWAVVAETLAFCGGAFIIAGDYSNSAAVENNEPLFPKLLRAGRILLALALLIVGIQHFMFAGFLASLITAWIPFKLFWAYFVGVAFLATSVSLLLNIETRLACTLLGFMFLFWVIFLHAPRVIADPYKEPEWTSLFIALGFSGIFFTIVSQYSRKIVV
jgi:uncharacterized membrane protein